VHYELWTGHKKAIYKDSEMKALFVSVTLLFILVLIGLSHDKVYDTVSVMFRKGFFHLVSAHSGTGFSTLYSQQFGSMWSPLAVVGLIIAMGFGGCLGSTTGAIKMMRLILVFKAFRAEIKRLMFSDSTVVVEKFHHIRDIVVEDKQIQAAVMVTLAFIVLYFAGALVGVFFGYPFLDSLFESTSAAANVGLSMGIVQTTMPAALKVTYIIEMWVGRLEFIAVFVLIGFFISWLKGK
jgi:trk system potassium uptake protein TrkH